MTAVDLFTEARAAGIVLDAEGDSLLVKAPRGVLTAAWKDRLLAHKPELLAILLPRAFVTLKGGLTLPVEVVELVLDLERRDIPLATDTDHQFVMPNDVRLTDADLVVIRRWRHHIAAAVEYRAPVE